MQMREVMQFDAEVSRRLRGHLPDPDIVEQRRLQLAALDLTPGESVLDIGSGPGLLAAHAAVTVGAGGSGVRDRPERADVGDRRAPERAGDGRGSGAGSGGRRVRVAVRR